MSGTPIPGVPRPKFRLQVPEFGRFVTVGVFLRLLGLTYFIAFSSFGVQAIGLIGSHGILPVGEFLRAVR